MATTKIFQNGNSQAIRIPQELRTDKKDYCINSDPWAAAKQVIGTFPSDFMIDRNQPSWADVPAREDL